ncbi:tRNA (guanosine(46)-N7)-methyltransferase TrmB [Wenxinia marina]|uniref:tRNA (guanine-N(7)-)-methyltransferase n=1 Tax=Wenxinia marina DSM 24838 TaxID=1123501 RepID=A0A0D0QHZ4_9RHOB|nr:tRNA (guanosine(46)-N7)-methyltransferase TrmB [Wenxinia marina]KIQ70658.1 tRNA (guanine-N(7)-)-methyltransferase [Wenxinia marina DSM 24838]GGL51440.1 tRNA (guanine-N(7)-)-methyltransferase [Wenxinia marina]
MRSDRHKSGAPWRNFHGRVHGKTLRPRQREMLDEDLAPLSPGPVGWEENPDRRPLDLAARFPGAREIWVEIGFGGGEHLVAMAARHPQVAILGAEPFVNGVAMLLRQIREAGVQNLAIHPGDVRDLFDVLPEGSAAKAFLNYPDPWPKQRHHKRRFVTPGYLSALHRVLAPGAEFRVATDIPDYVRQTLKEVPAAGFVREDHPTDRAWNDWPSTRYEQKALREGRAPHYLTFRRV